MQIRGAHTERKPVLGIPLQQPRLFWLLREVVVGGGVCMCVHLKNCAASFPRKLLCRRRSVEISAETTPDSLLRI